MIDILNAGMSHITDLGRNGKAHLGVQSNGAADQTSAALANILVGNNDDVALIESISFFPLTIRASAPILIAITGAAASVRIDGLTFPPNRPIPLWPGATVTIPPASQGLRRYLAVHGTIEADKFLGSVAFDPLIGRGTRLCDDDQVVVRSSAIRRTLPFPYYPINLRCPSQPARVELGVLPGPEVSEFPGILDGLANREFQIGKDSDHVGIRLDGGTYVRSTNTEIVSRGVPVGAIEIPPTGSMIALLRGRPLTAGYPIPLVVGRGWHSLLGQIRPGDTVTLTPTSTAHSLALAHKQVDLLHRARTLCRNAFEASEIFSEPMPEHALDPVTDD